MIKIKSKKAGFRRAGIAHPAAWTEYPEDRFTKQQLAVLKAEPMLKVEIVKDTPPAPDPDSEPEQASKPGKPGRKKKAEA